jgi:group I intron endonuclease
MKNCSGIYGGRNLVTDQIYVGSSTKCLSRTRTHVADLNNQDHHNPLLQAAWNKHGAAAFVWEILEECPEEGMTDVEQKWLDYFRSFGADCVYNIANPVVQRVPSERMSEAHMRYWEGLTPDERAARTAYLKSAEHQALATAGKQSEEFRAAQSARTHAQWADADMAERTRMATRQMLKDRLADPNFSATTGAKISAKAVARWKDPTYRKRGVRQIKAASDKARERLNDPEKMKERLELLAAVRPKAADGVRAKWADPIWRAKRIAQLKLPRKRRP